MKTLLIMRHAKSAWDDHSLKDWERPLIENGIRKTKKITDYFGSEKVVIDYIVSSHAVRAKETAGLVAEAIGYKKEDIFINNSIYESDENGLMNEVYALPNDRDNILIVGHNPTFSQFANIFLAKKIDFLPTSAVVSISFDTDKWEKVESSLRKVNFAIFPKKLK